MNLIWSNLIKLTGDGASRIKEDPGVYRLSYFNPSDQKYYVYYVGQAENLKTRLGEHLLNTETNSCCKGYLQKYDCYFRAAVVNLQSDRDGAEVALYNHFSPSCPERTPYVNPIDINFD